MAKWFVYLLSADENRSRRSLTDTHHCCSLGPRWSVRHLMSFLILSQKIYSWKLYRFVNKSSDWWDLRIQERCSINMLIWWKSFEVGVIVIAEDPAQNNLSMITIVTWICFVFQYTMDSHHGTTGTKSYFPARSVLFRREVSGVTYRIPALIFLQRSSCFLAFCEERLSPADSHAHLLVMRKGAFYRNYVEVCKKEATESQTTFTSLVLNAYISAMISRLLRSFPWSSGTTCESWAPPVLKATAQWTRVPCTTPSPGRSSSSSSQCSVTPQSRISWWQATMSLGSATCTVRTMGRPGVLPLTSLRRS